MQSRGPSLLVSALLEGMAADLQRDGFAFLTGLPVGFDHLAFLERFGNLRPQYGGATVMSIRDKAGGANVYHSMSRQELYPHTEAYEYGEAPPRYLALWCKQPPACGGGVTFLSDFETFFQGLNPDQRAWITTRRYTFTSTPGLIADGLGKEPVAHSIVSTADDGHRIARFSCTCLNSGGDAELDALVKQYVAYDETHRRSFSWSIDDLLIWDNHRYTHARSAFVDSSRELLRVWLEPFAASDRQRVSA
jgi:hypothetical protein